MPIASREKNAAFKCSLCSNLALSAGLSISMTCCFYLPGLKRGRLRVCVCVCVSMFFCLSVRPYLWVGVKIHIYGGSVSKHKNLYFL